MGRGSTFCCFCGDPPTRGADRPAFAAYASQNGDKDDDIESYYSAIQDSPIRRSIGASVPLDDSCKLRPCWSAVEPDRFLLRIGPNYSSTNAKAPSLAALYDSIGVDCFRDPTAIVGKVAHTLQFPQVPHFYDPSCGMPALLVLCAQIPCELPNLFGRSLDFGVSFVLYFMIRKETVDWGKRVTEILQKTDAGSSAIPRIDTLPDSEYLKFADITKAAGVPPAVRLFRKLLDRGYSDKKLALKGIGILRDFEKQKIPMSGIFKKYNGKPGTITASATFHASQHPYSYLEVDFDIRKWNILARTAFPQLKDTLKDLSADLGLVVEGSADEDLPERLLGSLTVHGLDWTRAHRFDAST